MPSYYKHHFYHIETFRYDYTEVLAKELFKSRKVGTVEIFFLFSFYSEITLIIYLCLFVLTIV